MNVRELTAHGERKRRLMVHANKERTRWQWDKEAQMRGKDSPGRDLPTRNDLRVQNDQNEVDANSQTDVTHIVRA
jgi:hypothetical protein